MFLASCIPHHQYHQGRAPQIYFILLSYLILFEMFRESACIFTIWIRDKKSKIFSTKTYFFKRKLFLSQKTISVTETCLSNKKVFLLERLVLWQKHIFVFLHMNLGGKFLWETGVSVISDNGDNKFVEPCTRGPEMCQLDPSKTYFSQHFEAVN